MSKRGPRTGHRGGPSSRSGLMVCGTTSNAGKSTLVTGLCRLLSRRGVSVAPFKAQNMALNSVVTPSGHEIGRAQGIQAVAAGLEPEVAMNPILLKPTADRTSQVIVLGRPIGVMSAIEYHEHKPQLLDLALDALADLRSRFDVVVCEGAGSPAEINLLDHDIVNLRIAHEAGLPAIVVGDIDLGGVFAALYGTVALLPDHYRDLVKGFVINKLRGDPALLLDGCAQLRARTGIPTLGVLPWFDGAGFDAEDSLALRDLHGTTAAPVADTLDVAVLALPRISNFTDLDPLLAEPGVSVRLVGDAAGLGRPDLVILPGTKSTVDDLTWLRARHLDEALAGLTNRRRGTSGADDTVTATNTATTILGICGGYQILGRTLDDEVESGAGVVDGLGLLPVTSRFEPEKVTRQRAGTAAGFAVHGYQIHHGRVRPDGGQPFVTLEDDGPEGEPDGELDGISSGPVFGTTLHGLFESDAFREHFLVEVGRRAGKRFEPAGTRFEQLRQDGLDRLADLLEEHLDVDALVEIMDGVRT
jgi:adenosylcobyric acid synthase